MYRQEKTEVPAGVPSSNDTHPRSSDGRWPSLHQSAGLAKFKVFLFHPGGQDSTNRKIFRAALTIGLVSTVAKVCVAFKDLIVAHTFGRSDALDAFLIAFLLPSFVLNLVMGSLGSALIPVLVEARQKRGTGAEQ